MAAFEIHAPREQPALGIGPFHSWSSPAGGDWLQFFRDRDGFLLRFPDLADFNVSFDGKEVTCRPVPEVSGPTLDHLYLNQVLPLALSKQGSLVFHGSAVAVGRGAVVFLGMSGRGKSTLAAAFATRGRAFLTDDAVVIDAAEDGVKVLPSHASIRLWDDSRENLVAGNTDLAPSLDYTSKGRLLAGPGLVHCREPRRLLTVYVLGDGGADDVTLRRLTAAEMLVAWTSHSFLLDIEDRGLIQRHFERVATLADRLTGFSLDYPRRYDDLTRVLAALAEHAETLDMT